MIHREHIAQKHCRLFVREAVAAPHEFFSFDRVSWLKGETREARMMRMARERARGLVKATPDTLLQVTGLPDIWCEWKVPGEHPDDDQMRMGDKLLALGRIWFWVTSIDQYAVQLKANGVPLVFNWAFLAMHHDGCIASQIAKAKVHVVKPRAGVKIRYGRRAA